MLSRTSTGRWCQAPVEDKWKRDTPTHAQTPSLPNAHVRSLPPSFFPSRSMLSFSTAPSSLCRMPGSMCQRPSPTLTSGSGVSMIISLRESQPPGQVPATGEGGGLEGTSLGSTGKGHNRLLGGDGLHAIWGRNTEEAATHNLISSAKGASNKGASSLPWDRRGW